MIIPHERHYSYFRFVNEIVNNVYIDKRKISNVEMIDITNTYEVILVCHFLAFRSSQIRVDDEDVGVPVYRHFDLDL